MNMQSKLYMIQFFSSHNDWSTANPWAERSQTSKDFHKFHENPEKKA